MRFSHSLASEATQIRTRASATAATGIRCLTKNTPGLWPTLNLSLVSVIERESTVNLLQRQGWETMRDTLYRYAARIFMDDDL